MSSQEIAGFIDEVIIKQPSYILGTQCVHCQAPLVHPLQCNQCKRRFSLAPLSSPFEYLGLPFQATHDAHVLKKAYEYTLHFLHPCKFSRYTQHWRRQQEALVHRAAFRLQSYFGWISAYYEVVLLQNDPQNPYVSDSQRMKRMNQIDHGFKLYNYSQKVDDFWLTPWHELVDLDSHQDKAMLWHRLWRTYTQQARELTHYLTNLTRVQLDELDCQWIEKQLLNLYHYEQSLHEYAPYQMNRWHIQEQIQSNSGFKKQQNI